MGIAYNPSVVTDGMVLALDAANPKSYTGVTTSVTTTIEDPYADNVSLLLNGNGTNGSTTFTDSSSYNHTVTANGDAQISTTQRKFGGASMYFDGSGYLTLPNDQTAFDFGTSDFTIESWIYWPGGGGNIFSQRHAFSNNNTGMTWRTIPNYLQFFYGNGLGSFVTPSGSLSTNTWNHIALTRNGNTFTMWINGQSKATNTITASMIYYPPVIGRVQGVNSEYFTGYLDDFRITKGVARYTSNFEPPTAQLPDFGNTITDSSSYNHTVTPVGNAQISTTQSKFGEASIYLDGSGDYLILAEDNSLDFGNGDFTFELWVYILSQSLDMMVGSSSAYSNVQFFRINTGGTYEYLTVYLNGDFLSIPNSGVTVNSWHHLALTRSGTTVRVFVDGTLAGSATSSRALAVDKIGAFYFQGNLYTSQYYFKGYIDDLRITKGVARYTSNFEPPTAQLPGVKIGETGTFASGVWKLSDHIKRIRNELWPGLVSSIVTDGLVLHLDAGDSASYPGSGTTWTDLSGNGNDGTLVNGVGFDSDNGGSLTFDGVDDRVIVSNVQPNTNDFTISVWVYKFNNTSNDYIWDFGENGGTLASGIDIGFRYYNVTLGLGSNIYTQGTVPEINKWYNVVISRNSGTSSMYVNGSFITSSSGDTHNISSTTLTIGDYGGNGQYSLDGYISNFLIYNKALTPSEITQNFDALKGRYGL